MLVKVSVVNGDPPYEVGDDIAFQGRALPSHTSVCVKRDSFIGYVLT